MTATTWWLSPVEQLEPETESGFNWRSTGCAPAFELHPPDGKFPRGAVFLRVPLRVEGKAPPLVRLFLDTGRGYHASQSIILKDLWAVVQLPAELRGLRLAMPPYPGPFFLGEIKVRTIGYWEAVLRLGWARFRTATWTWGGLVRAVRRVLRANQQEERSALVQFFHAYQLPVTGTQQSYDSWIRLYASLSNEDRNAIRKRIAKWTDPPRFSIVLFDDTDKEGLLRTADSLRRQLYSSWALCLTRTNKDTAAVKDILSTLNAKQLQLINVDKEESSTGKWNRALSQVTGEWVVCMDCGGELSEHALYMLAEELSAFPDTDLMYSDEDELADKGRQQKPSFKPDWSPDLFAAHAYMGRFLALRTDWIRAVSGLREGYPGAEEYDLLWRIRQEHPDMSIRHIPHVLYHNPARTPEQSALAGNSACKAAAVHLGQSTEATKVEPNPLGPWGHRVRRTPPSPEPLVSIIVPTRDRAQLLRQCTRGVREETDYPAWELIIVNNQSEEEDTLRLFKELSTDERIRILDYDRPFNYSAINNYAARKARGALLCFLNNDIEMTDRGWLREMVSHAVRKEIGAVGARLWFPDGTLQHGGCVMGMAGWAGHLHYGLPSGQAGYDGRAILMQNVSAVTGACLLTRREIFGAIDGFNEANLPVTFNDVDLCLRIRKKGYWILWTPYAELRHHETATRGLNDTPEKRRQAERELHFMLEHWPRQFHSDPFYNPNLSLAWHDFSPAFPPRTERPWRKT